MGKYPEYELVQKCLLQIETQLGWGASEHWHNEVFTELSEVLHQTTNILLSPTTLKRVWGRINYKSKPSISTLNALSQFAGYSNWRDFKNQMAVPEEKKVDKKSLSNRGLILTSAAFMTILFISLFSMIGSDGNQFAKADYSKISFSSYPVAEGLPNSVVFDFNLENVQSDSIFIQQFWDPTKTIKISSEQKQATGIYYWPGYFRAKLLIDGQILKEHDLFIKSEGWIGTVDYEPVPKYVNVTDLINENLKFPSAIIKEITSSSKPIISTYHLVDDFREVSGDNFLFETSFRTVYQEKWAVCQRTRVVILGTSGALLIPFSIPGCVSDIGLMLNDVYLNGKKHDLSAFGINLSTFRNIKINIQEKQVKIFVDQDKIYAGQYHQSIGRLVGIRYRFLGAGEVERLKITNSRGKIILNEAFSNVQQ